MKNTLDRVSKRRKAKSKKVQMWKQSKVQARSHKANKPQRGGVRTLN
jgi:hypothetical protein